jgi:hypothetical protein
MRQPPRLAFRLRTDPVESLAEEVQMTGCHRVLGSAGLAALLLAGGGRQAVGQDKSPEKPPMSVDGIRDTSEAFAGKRVRFTGHVDRVLGSRALIFKDQDPAGKEHLLGVTRRPIRQLLGEGGAELKGGDEVLVTGVVRTGGLPQIEAELGVDLDPGTEKQFRDKPVVIISEMIRTDE